MLSNVLSRVDGKIASQCLGLFKEVFNNRPPKKQFVLEWNLELILEGTPFEPRRKAPLNPVTHKFVLLLALVSSRRVSDLSHVASGVFCRIQNSTITFLQTDLATTDYSFHFLRLLLFPLFLTSCWY